METISLLLIALCAVLIKILLGVADYRKINQKSQVSWYGLIMLILILYVSALYYDPSTPNELYYTLFVLLFFFTMEKQRSRTRISMNGFFAYLWIRTFRN